MFGSYPIVSGSDGFVVMVFPKDGERLLECGARIADLEVRRQPNAIGARQFSKFLEYFIQCVQDVCPGVARLVLGDSEKTVHVHTRIVLTHEFEERVCNHIGTLHAIAA